MPTIEQLSAAFKLFDVNGDGILDTDEVLAILTRSATSLTREDAQSCIDAMIASGADLDGDGKLSVEEFARAWASTDSAAAEAAVCTAAGAQSDSRASALSAASASGFSCATL